MANEYTDQSQKIPTLEPIHAEIAKQIESQITAGAIGIGHSWEITIDAEKFTCECVYLKRDPTKGGVFRISSAKSSESHQSMIEEKESGATNTFILKIVRSSSTEGREKSRTEAEIFHHLKTTKRVPRLFGFTPGTLHPSEQSQVRASVISEDNIPAAELDIYIQQNDHNPIPAEIQADAIYDAIRLYRKIQEEFGLIASDINPGQFFFSPGSKCFICTDFAEMHPTGTPAETTGYSEGYPSKEQISQLPLSEATPAHQFAMMFIGMTYPKRGQNFPTDPPKLSQTITVCEHTTWFQGMYPYNTWSSLPPHVKAVLPFIDWARAITLENNPNAPLPLQTMQALQEAIRPHTSELATSPPA